MSLFFDPLQDFKGRRIGYARVSTSDQKVRSQCDLLKAAKCDRIFIDKGISGSKHKRPAFNDMLAYLKTGDAVLVWRFDRLGRSVSHLAQLLKQFHDDGIFFYSFTEGINTTTSGGKFVYHVLAAVAEFQRDIIIENTHAGLEAAKARGSKLGRPPALSVDEAIKAYDFVFEAKHNPNSVACQFGVSRNTLDRTFVRYGLTR